MFHAASYKQTESAKNYSGNSIPYLTVTTSPEQITGEQAHYSYDHLAKKLQHKLTKVQLQTAKLHYNDTNRVEQITIGKKTWSGREFEQCSIYVHLLHGNNSNGYYDYDLWMGMG